MRFLLLFTVLALPVAAQGVMPSSIPVEAEALDAVSSTQPAPPFMVRDVTVELDEGLGFARDSALTAAARKGLPLALAQLTPPMPETQGEEIAASVGEPLQFVQRYEIVKEVLVPVYRLTVNLQFNEEKLKLNFGGKVGAQGDVSATGVVEGELQMPVAKVLPAVRVTAQAASARGQDVIFRKLEEAGFKPQWDVLRADGGEMIIHTAEQGLPLVETLRAAGMNASNDSVDWGRITITQ